MLVRLRNEITPFFRSMAARVCHCMRKRTECSCHCMLERIPRLNRLITAKRLTNTPAVTARSANRRTAFHLAARAPLHTAQLGVCVYASVCNFVGTSAVSKRTECSCHCMLERIPRLNRLVTTKRSTTTPSHTARSANRLAGFQWQLDRRFTLLNLMVACWHRLALCGRTDTGGRTE